MAQVLRKETHYNAFHSILYLTILAACNIVAACLVWKILALTIEYVVGAG